MGDFLKNLDANQAENIDILLTELRGDGFCHDFAFRAMMEAKRQEMAEGERKLQA